MKNGRVFLYHMVVIIGCYGFCRGLSIYMEFIHGSLSPFLELQENIVGLAGADHEGENISPRSTWNEIGREKSSECPSAVYSSCPYLRPCSAANPSTYEVRCDV